MDKFIGKRLDGRYEILELIGSGGMANVYKAHDILENTTVAIKILKDEFSENVEFLRRFKNESKAIALLSHPNIVKVLDVSFGDLIQYIVMEYVPGITLKQYIEQQGVLSWKETVHFTVQVLRALQHAHDNGIVHRDVKPQNIMLLQDGTIKVMDFGIARFARDDSKTITDKAIGSVHYISPEQARGDVIDEKTDIYSVGVMMFEMLTGKLPFDADNAVSVAIMQMQAAPKMPREINATIPEGLEEITVRAMQKDPSKRYQSAAEMLRDIDEFKRNPSIVFEYKYFGNDEETKYFDLGNQDDHLDKSKKKEKDLDEEENEKKTHTIPILAGIAGAFVIVSVIVCVLIFGLGGFFDKVPDFPAPNLVGKVYNDVINDPQYEKIKIVQKTTAYSSEYPEGQIIEQDPKAGTKVKENAEIQVTVSKGAESTDVPDVYGLPETEARDQLEKAGLKVSQVVNQFDETVTKGTVIKTSPERGQPVKEGDEVIIYVSSGKDEQPIIMPKLIGSQRADAEQRLAALNLKYQVKEVNSSEPAGMVISQSIAEGQIVPEASLVVLEVSNGTPDVKSVSINVNFSGASAHYTNFIFRVYMDGVKQREDEVNITATGSYSFSLQGSGGSDHDIRVMVVPVGSSEREQTLARYSVTFETGSVSEISKDTSVFSKYVPDSSESGSSTDQES